MSGGVSSINLIDRGPCFTVSGGSVRVVEVGGGHQ